MDRTETVFLRWAKVGFVSGNPVTEYLFEPGALVEEAVSSEIHSAEDRVLFSRVCTYVVGACLMS